MSTLIFYIMSSGVLTVIFFTFLLPVYLPKDCSDDFKFNNATDIIGMVFCGWIMVPIITVSAIYDICKKGIWEIDERKP